MWPALPAGLAVLKIGNARQPVAVSIDSRGDFAIRGAVRAEFYNAALAVDGQVDLSPQHALVSGVTTLRAGEASYRVELEGRIGHGTHFSLAGDGQLTLFGQPTGRLEARIDEGGARLAGHLDLASLPVAGTAQSCTLALDSEGAIDFPARWITLTGRSSFEIFGARAEGQALLTAQPSGVDLSVEGALAWQGRRWLGGRLDVGTVGVTIAGRTAFALDLTPANLAGIDLANLFLRLDIAGRFTLANGQSLISAEIEGDWTLAARLPGGGGQVLPIAAQRLHVDAAAGLPVLLLQVSGFKLVGFGGISIPLPTIKGKGSALRFGKKNSNMAASWAGKTVELIGGLVPVVSDGNLSTGQTDAKVFFDFDVDWDDANPLRLQLPLQGEFTLSLVWRPNGKLAIEVRRGGVSRYVELG